MPGKFRLLTLPRSRFLADVGHLFGATAILRKGNCSGSPAPPRSRCAAHRRPVPLEFEYSETPRSESVGRPSRRRTVRRVQYLVYLTQRSSPRRHRNPNEPRGLAPRRQGRPAAGIGAVSALQQPLRQGSEALAAAAGSGIHHAGLLPKYRVLVETSGPAGPAQARSAAPTPWGWASTCRSARWSSRSSGNMTAKKIRRPQRARFSPGGRARRAQGLRRCVAMSSPRRRSTSLPTSGLRKRMPDGTAAKRNS